MFLLKKIISPLCYPLTFILLLLAAGIICLWRGRRPRAGKMMLAAGFMLLAFCSLPSGPWLLVAPLERQHPPLLNPAALQGRQLPPNPCIVVLGGGVMDDEALPLSSRLGSPTLHRLLEGVRLWRLLPGSRLLLSGGQGFGHVSEAELMARAAGLMGVAAEHVVLESQSQDTAQQAEFLAPRLAGQRFILVTSALHMPRAMFLFRRQGLDPAPAPTDYQVRLTDTTRYAPGWFFPSPYRLNQVQAAWHEYLGLGWYWLTTSKPPR